MPKIPKISDIDEGAFKEAMRGVKRLKAPDKITFRPAPPKKIRKPRVIEEEPVPFQFSDHENLEPVGGDDLLTFARSGLQHKILRKLRGGQYNIEAILDLHRKTVEEARESLNDFLLRCQKRGVCRVLIIHGKGHGRGKPILKNKLNHWLRQTDYVLAFCSAAPKDGKSGAVYVLLRR